MTVRLRTVRRTGAACVLALPVLAGSGPAFAASAAPAAPAPAAPAACPSTTSDELTGVYYQVNSGPHLATLAGHVRGGDRVTATFTVIPACSGVRISLAAYAAKAGFRAADQTLAASDTGVFTGGPHSLTVTTPCMFQVDFVGGPAQSPLTQGYYGSHHLLVDAAAGGSACVSGSGDHKPPAVAPGGATTPPVVAGTTLTRPVVVAGDTLAAAAPARPTVVAGVEQSLPFTGVSDTAGLGSLGAGLVLTGALSVAAGRRVRSPAAPARLG